MSRGFRRLAQAPAPEQELILDLEHFREACARYATGITVATVVDATGAPHGLTASSFTSVSWLPPLVLVCIDHRATAHEHFKTARSFAINILGEEQKELSVRFATPAPDRFKGVAWKPGILGAPLLENVLAWLECEVDQIVNAGDHTVFIGEVKNAFARDGRPLVYFYRDYRHLNAEASEADREQTLPRATPNS